MPSIDGRYEWDDDELVPGRKKEGGLHQNLFDDQGDLKGSARFIPSDEDADASPEVVYVPYEVRPPAWSAEQEALEKAVAEQLTRLVDFAIARLRPHAETFWADRALPAMRLKVASATDRWNRRKTKNATGDPSLELVVTPADRRVAMDEAEARARYLLALAAQAFADEQLRRLRDADVRGGEQIAELPPTDSAALAGHVAELAATFSAHPSLVDEILRAEHARRPELAPVQTRGVSESETRAAMHGG